MMKHHFLDHTENSVFTTGLNKGNGSLQTHLLLYVINKAGDKRLAIHSPADGASSKLLPDRVLPKLFKLLNCLLRATDAPRVRKVVKPS